MRHFGKRLFGLFLAACMTLSLLPSTVYAAVGGLLRNSPAENQALLEQLGALTGYDAEAAQALLEQYGLLDEDGNLDIDQTVELDGVEYTLEEIEALLDGPDTDLSRVGYVDGVPMVCTIDGVLRGLLADGIPVHKGMKSGDIDPRCSVDHCFCASDKALAVGGGVLEAVLHLSGALEN